MTRSFPAVLDLQPVRFASGTVVLPGSKSISNRVLLLAALSSGTCRLKGVLRADDTDRMLDALRVLGVRIAEDEKDPAAFTVEGCAGRFPVREAEIFLGNAGTAARPLTAALALMGGNFSLDGVERMRERPIGGLLGALRELGADVRCLKNEGYFPLVIGNRRQTSGLQTCHVPGSVSSQFLTALLMASPVYSGPEGTRIVIEGELISRPYVAMTVRLMEVFGIRVKEEENGFFVPHGEYRAPETYAVEGDASGASYFLALGALAGGPVRVSGVGERSIQGDIAFARVLQSMGARVTFGDDWVQAAAPEKGKLSALDFDCTEIPDAAMTLAALGLFTAGPVMLRGIGSWRVKETDRIEALQAELRKFGAAVESGADWMRVSPPETLQSAEIRTYKDHRMAMSLSLAACGGVSVRVQDPECVSKTFPEYFEEFARLTEV